MTFEKQIAFVKEKGWFPYYQEAANAYNIPIEILLGKDSRETLLGTLPGIIQRGWIGSDGKSTGISQINKEVFDFARIVNPSNVKQYVHYGAKILRDEMNRFPGNMKAALAAYNAGAGRVASALRSGVDPDLVTTHKNYGSDVLRRAQIFKKLVGGNEEIIIGSLIGISLLTVGYLNQVRR